MNEKILLILLPLALGLVIGIVSGIAIYFSLKKHGIGYHEVDHTGDGFIDGYE